MNTDTARWGSLDTLDCVILCLDHSLNIEFINRFAFQLLGHESTKQIVGSRLDEYLHVQEQKRESLNSIFGNIKQHGTLKHVEFDLVGINGKRIPMAWNIRYRNDSHSKLNHFILAGMEISLYRRIQEEAVMFRTVVANYNGAILITDANYHILYSNNAVTRATGYSAEELVGLTPSIFSSGKTPEPVYAEMKGALNKGEIWTGEFINRRKYGELFKEGKSIAAIRDANGDVQYYFSIGEDLSAKTQYEQKIDYLLYFDSLTGLLNQSGFMQSLASAIDAAKKLGKEVAVLHLDIDEFTKISSSLGLEYTEVLIVDVGKRIKDSLDYVDLIARTGRDSFVVMLHALKTGAEINSREVAARILSATSTPFSLPEQDISLAISIGIACYPHDGSSAQQILSNAIRATLFAKDEGGNTSTLYAETSLFNAGSGLLELWQATDRGEMRLHYQPQNSLFSGEIVGLEALLRWQHPVRGLLPPGEFLPLIENSQHIVKIGEWVLTEACRQMRAWIDMGIPPIKVAINLSARHFRMPNLPDVIAAALAEFDIAPNYLEIEISESAMMQDIAAAVVTIRQLKEMGVRLSLDDFGTGFSSMTYLSRFPIDMVKIDQSFIHDITTNYANAAIAQATIAMSHKLGKKVIAEGVETFEQMQFLRRSDCDEMQGYLFSRPCPPEEICRILREDVRLNVFGESLGEEREYIMLVDDEPSILSSLKRILRRENYLILTANSAFEGFSLMAQYPVQLIVCDQRMPEMSGIKFLSQIKAMYPKTVRIILSGYSDISVVTDAINDGAVYRYLSKPWNEEQVKSEIRNGLRYWRELYAGN